MPAAMTQVPVDYRFVLRRYDRAPEIPMIFATYAETTYSRNLHLEGTAAPTIFLKTIPAKERALKLGWIDVTNKFNLEHSVPATMVETVTEFVEPKVRARRGRPKKS
jgi:hypothetical protein